MYIPIYTLACLSPPIPAYEVPVYSVYPMSDSSFIFSVETSADEAVCGLLFAVEARASDDIGKLRIFVESFQLIKYD